jgi:hypothetical protein
VVEKMSESRRIIDMSVDIKPSENGSTCLVVSVCCSIYVTIYFS